MRQGYHAWWFSYRPLCLDKKCCDIQLVSKLEKKEEKMLCLDNLLDSSSRGLMLQVLTYKTVLRTTNQYISNMTSKTEQFRRRINLGKYYLGMEEQQQIAAEAMQVSIQIKAGDTYSDFYCFSSSISSRVKSPRCQDSSDVDPDPVGSAFIWIQGYKIKEILEFSHQIFGVFSQDIIFFESEPKKVANL